MQLSLIQKRRRFWVRILQGIVATGICFLISAVHAQDIGWRDRPWVHKPSAGLAAKFQHWRLTFELGEQQSAPEKGIFASVGPGYSDGTARLVSDLTPAPSVKLTAVVKRVRYVRKGDGHTDPADKDVTSDVIDTLRSPEVIKFVEKERLNNVHLDVEKDFAVALVQDFDIALRTPRRKEHVWSVNWRVERQTETSYAGYEAWGLFTRISGALHPLYLAGRVSNGEAPGVSYYYVLATGDLNGDGIDELVAEEEGFEKEQDDLELWAWERGAPVTIHRMLWR
jgi:hypothetical protein